MKSKTILFLILPFLIAASCKKNDDEIDTGFKCRLNGKTWRPYVDDFKLQEVEAHVTGNGESIHILARNTGSHEHISLALYYPGEIIQAGVYELNEINAPFGHYNKNDFQGVYSTKAGYTGTLEIIKIDNELKNISGRFSFRAHNETTNNIVNITEGIFNIKFTNY